MSADDFSLLHDSKTENYPKIIRTLIEQWSIEGSMTLRRCWYVLLGKQLVKEHPSPDPTPSQKNAPYRRLSQILLSARIKEDLPWEVIVDRVRRMDKPLTWENVDEAVNYVLNNFNFDPMPQQKEYVEVWVEKDTVGSKIYATTAKFFAPLITARGFSSGTYMHDAAVRFNEIPEEKPITILYLSDYDPEGEYFPKLFHEQLESRYGCEHSITVKKIALTKQQIIDWTLPRIPLTVHPAHGRKMYVLNYLVDNEEYRNGRWKVELDAVNNIVLSKLIEAHLRDILDVILINRALRRSKRASAQWRKKYDFKKSKHKR